MVRYLLASDNQKKHEIMAVFGVKKEETRPVPGYGGAYVADRDGNIWRNGSVLVATRGYVSLSHGGKVEKVKVAYAVARAWIANPELRPYVRHRNGDAEDNRVENLEWSERREGGRGRRRVDSAVTVWRKYSGELVGSWPSVRSACMALGLNEGNVMRQIRGEAKSVKGYIFTV